MKKLLNLFLNFIVPLIGVSQINPSNIDIVRDTYGVPHIFAKTDSEVAYGLAWAHAEDDFKTIQIGYLAGNNLLSKYIGNQGLGADFISQFIGSDKLFDENYLKDISYEYKNILRAYADGLNRYAELNPKEVLVRTMMVPLLPIHY